MVKVVVEGDPREWGKRFTELVCREWYGKGKDMEPPSSDAGKKPGGRESA